MKIGYTLFGVSDLEKSAKIYEPFMQALGAQRIVDDGRIIGWMGAAGQMLGICYPADGNPATQGNGTMIALDQGDEATVDAMLEKAKECGFQSVEDAHRSDAFYGGYARDLDNNKIAIYHMAASE